MNEVPGHPRLTERDKQINPATKLRGPLARRNTARGGRHS